MSQRQTKRRTRRINWTNLADVQCALGVDNGLYAQTIGDNCIEKLTKGQVYYRSKLIGRSVTAYRKGEGPVGSIVVKRIFISSTDRGVDVAEKELRLIFAKNNPNIFKKRKGK